MEKINIDEEKKERFIQKAKIVHGDKYDYSKVEYINNHIKIIIICPIHGEFKQTPNSHLQGCNCPKCAHQSYRYTNESFIEKARQIHGDKYDYSKINYIDNTTKICIICKEHGEFWQRPDVHLRGFNCPKCYGLGMATEEWIEKAKQTHGDKYDYSQTVYVNARTKVKIICPIHGEFWQRTNDHIYGSGCPYCKESKLEKQINIFLLEKTNIKYIRQQKFEWLGTLSLDFYLPQYKIAIECQGKQHFEINSFYKNIDQILERDQRKRELCHDNGVQLVYYLDKKYNKHVENLGIPYFNDCESLLNFINDNFS